jgi:hypothetical protein
LYSIKVIAGIEGAVIDFSIAALALEFVKVAKFWSPASFVHI